MARCKSLMRRIFVTVLQSWNPAHVDAGGPCWDPCQFGFYLRGTMSSCAACVGTPRWELKEKCQYCVGGQSTHAHTHTHESFLGRCAVIGSKYPQFVQLTRLPLKSSVYTIGCNVQLTMSFFIRSTPSHVGFPNLSHIQNDAFK